MDAIPHRHHITTQRRQTQVHTLNIFYYFETRQCVDHTNLQNTSNQINASTLQIFINFCLITCQVNRLPSRNCSSVRFINLRFCVDKTPVTNGVNLNSFSYLNEKLFCLCFVKHVYWATVREKKEIK